MYFSSFIFVYLKLAELTELFLYVGPPKKDIFFDHLLQSFFFLLYRHVISRSCYIFIIFIVFGCYVFGFLKQASFSWLSCKHFCIFLTMLYEKPFSYSFFPDTNACPSPSFFFLPACLLILMCTCIERQADQFQWSYRFRLSRRESQAKEVTFGDSG